MHPFIVLINQIIGLYSFAVLLYVIIQLLAYFKVLNMDQPAVAKIYEFLAKIVEPALAKIRIYIKPYNNIDFSPLVLLLLLHFIQYCLVYYFY